MASPSCAGRAVNRVPRRKNWEMYEERHPWSVIRVPDCLVVLLQGLSSDVAVHGDSIAEEEATLSRQDFFDWKMRLKLKGSCYNWRD
jgi:hypothetical protein